MYSDEAMELLKVLRGGKFSVDRSSVIWTQEKKFSAQPLIELARGARLSDGQIPFEKEDDNKGCWAKNSAGGKHEMQNL